MVTMTTGNDSFTSIGSDVITLTTVAASGASSVELDYLQIHLKTIRFVVQKIMIPAVVAFGVTGNLVNIAVLTRRWMKSSTNSYLTALAIYDMLYLVLALTLTLVHHESAKSSSWYQRYEKPYGRPLTDTASNTGVWLTLTFTVERYIGVCHPMKGKIWCTPKRAQAIVVVVCLAAAAATLPEFFEFQVVESIVNAAVVNGSSAEPPATTRVKITVTEFGQSSFYSRFYRYANQAMFTFVPLALLLVFNTLLIHAVLAAARRRQQMAKTGRDVTAASERQDRQRRGQQRITVMLISVVIVFLLCQLPQALQGLYIVYCQVSGTLDIKKLSILKITGNVFNLLVVINCSVNFVLYSSFSSKFRMTFGRLFCRYRLCSMCGPSTPADRRQLDDDGIEMSCARGGADARLLIQRNAKKANPDVSPNYRRQQPVTLLVTAPDSSTGRKLSLASRLRRSLSRDRKQRSPILITTPSTSRYGLSSMTRCPSGSSMSEAVALMASTGSDSGLGGVTTTNNIQTYATML